jgi:hypothetical protein
MERLGLELEHHYDYQQSDEPLGYIDLRFNGLEPPTGFHKSA